MCFRAAAALRRHSRMESSRPASGRPASDERQPNADRTIWWRLPSRPESVENGSDESQIGERQSVRIDDVVGNGELIVPGRGGDGNVGAG